MKEIINGAGRRIARALSDPEGLSFPGFTEGHYVRTDKTFHESTDLQCSFLEKLLHLDMPSVADFSESMVDFLQPSPENKFVYGLAAGRSALALYSFMQLIQNHFENVFPSPWRTLFRGTTAGDEPGHCHIRLWGDTIG